MVALLRAVSIAIGGAAEVARIVETNPQLAAA
jgi:hypothetical protein